MNNDKVLLSAIAILLTIGGIQHLISRQKDEPLIAATAKIVDDDKMEASVQPIEGSLAPYVEQHSKVSLKPARNLKTSRADQRKKAIQKLHEREQDEAPPEKIDIYAAQEEMKVLLFQKNEETAQELTEEQKWALIRSGAAPW